MRKVIKIIEYPFKIFFLGVIGVYKVIISPIIPKTCRFTPTCSTYTIQAIKEFGVIKGGVIGTKRLIKCGPWSKGGFDPIPLNIKGELRWLL